MPVEEWLLAEYLAHTETRVSMWRSGIFMKLAIEANMQP